VVVLAGVYLASKEHQWSSFYVGWGVIAALVLGALEGSLIIRSAGRLAEHAERDLAATAVPAGGQRTSATWSSEYVATMRRFTLAGNAMAAIVVLTVFFMATHLGA
jgi:K+-sensing histidine kinase KdpD